MKRTTIFLPETLKEKLKEKSKTKGISMSEYIRRALDKILEDDKND